VAVRLFADRAVRVDALGGLLAQPFDGVDGLGATSEEGGRQDDGHRYPNPHR
jgi:hypothetical protein